LNKQGKYRIARLKTRPHFVTLVCVFVIPCLTAWHKEHKLKKAIKKDPGVAETGIII